MSETVQQITDAVTAWQVEDEKFVLLPNNYLESINYSNEEDKKFHKVRFSFPICGHSLNRVAEKTASYSIVICNINLTKKRAFEAFWCFYLIRV